MSSENDRSADNQQEIDISDEYFLGFIEGEGCFYVGFGKRKDLPLGWQVITEFHLSQNPGGKIILEAFKRRIKGGYIKPNHAKSTKDKTWVLIIKNREDLKTRLIPFLEKHKLRSSKYQDFVIFKRTLELIETKKHLSKDGFQKIVKLVFSSERNTNKRYSQSEILRPSETISRTPIKSEKI